MNPEGNEFEIPSGEIAKLATAATQMVGQMRQIKILILIYAVASLTITIGSTVYFATASSMLDEHEDESETPEAEPVGPSEGDPLPPISLTDADGRVWDDRNLSGKVVLLNFWATWCGPCRREMPIFDEVQRKYESRGFTVLAVSLDREGWDVVQPYIAELKPAYPVFVADEGVEREFGRITSLPTTYFVRRDGTIDTEHVGGLSKSHIVNHIESLLEGKAEQGTDAAVPDNPSSPQAEAACNSASMKKEASSHDARLPERANEVRVRDIDDYSLPRMLGLVAPRFSNEVRDAKLEGSVELELRVHEDGSAHDIKVVRGLGTGLDERVIEAVRKSRFKPAKKAGKPISTLRRIRVGLDVKKTVRPYDHEE